jgi:hypothetical protein
MAFTNPSYGFGGLLLKRGIFGNTSQYPPGGSDFLMNVCFNENQTILCIPGGSNGNVGIGTTNPVSPLQIQCNDGYTGGITLSHAATSASGPNEYMIQRGLVGGTILGAGTNTSNIMLFHTTNETTSLGGGKTGFVWVSSGPRLGMYFDTTNSRLGIGTVNPSQLLELSYSGSTGRATLFPGNRIPQIGGGNAKNYLQVQCQDASTPALGSNITLFTDATGLGPSIEYTSSYHNFLNTSGARIGYFQAALTGGTMTLSVDANGGIIRTSSDARLKNNVHDITYGLETIIQLRPVFFEWNDHKRFGTGRQVGMIAQEVRALVPEVVSACLDEIGTLSLDYVKIVPILIKSVQELSAKNTDLEARIAALESK